MLSSADPGGKQQSAAFRRKDQLDRWANSSTDNQPIKRKENSTKVNFTSGTVFLAACSQCDKKEVEELIRDGVNPNTFNVDGLTALHQVSQLSNIQRSALFCTIAYILYQVFQKLLFGGLEYFSVHLFAVLSYTGLMLFFDGFIK